MMPEEQLLAWVSMMHKGQLIRCTAESYLNHLLAVAKMAAPATAWGYEIGLCHDLLEKTSVTKGELLIALISFDYDHADALLICSCVIELTDVFTAGSYPSLSKSERKRREAIRLTTVSSIAQTVKYADLIYNMEWVGRYDQKHARQYLQKKQELLLALTLGDHKLRQQALDLAHLELKKLKL